MNRVRNRLIAVFVAATVVPLGLTLWVAQSLLERSLRYSASVELDELSKSLESTARHFYWSQRSLLREQVASHRLAPRRFSAAENRLWPAEMQSFWDSPDSERFLLTGPGGGTLTLLVRGPDEVLRYERELGGVQLEALRSQYARARKLVDETRARDLRRGFFWTLLLLAAVPWLAALSILIFATHRVTTVATRAYNRMASDLQHSRERLLFLTRLESWQALARKTAHEVKNSLTPIRLMMEELASRRQRPEDAFERQAAAVIVSEVTGLERRVRAFSELAAEPPVRLKPLDPKTLLEERVAFLRSAHPGVSYRLNFAPAAPDVLADEDLLRGVLTNLLENAAEAAGPRGSVLAKTTAQPGAVAIEVHDSGPGVGGETLETLFEPSISFKKNGMGLGLSIARKSAILCGGDIVLIKGELGGAGFRVLLPAPCPQSAS